MRAERLMVLDAPSLYFRAFFGVPPTTARDGTPVNAVRGLLDFIAHLVRVRRPTHLVACMDADWRPAWRVAAVPSYKTHRVATGVPPGPGVVAVNEPGVVAVNEPGVVAVNEPGVVAVNEIVPDELEVQVPIICDVLDALGIPWVGVAEHEADDVVGTLATRSPRPVDVVTGDRDLFQLVDDARDVRVLYVAKGVARHQIVDEAAIRSRYGIPGRAYADFALLRGDPSDGLPGAVGIGEKTAAALIARHGSIREVLAAAEDEGSSMRGDLRRKLLASREYLVRAEPVVRVVCDLPIPPLDDELPSEPVDPAAVVALCDRLGLDASFNRVLVAMATAGARD